MSKHSKAKTDNQNMPTRSEADSVFPTQSEFKVDEGTPNGSKSKHPGLIWMIIAVVAVIISCIVFAAVGDWNTPQEAQQINDAITNYEIHP